MPGKLIVLEGTDGAGKATQAGLLQAALQRDYQTKTISYPRYGQPMAQPVEFYLAGRWGRDPMAVNPYTVSAFYAIDRFDSYQTEWKDLYLSGGIIIADRYTTSNAVYQTSKLPPEDRHAFLDWLYDFEYHKIGIPEPDLVLCLDVDPEAAHIANNEAPGIKPGVKDDIHEHDKDYLIHAYNGLLDTAKYSGWTMLPCTDGRRILPPGTIHKAILAEVQKLLALEVRDDS